MEEKDMKDLAPAKETAAEEKTAEGKATAKAKTAAKSPAKTSKKKARGRKASKGGTAAKEAVLKETAGKAAKAEDDKIEEIKAEETKVLEEEAEKTAALAEPQPEKETEADNEANAAALAEKETNEAKEAALAEKETNEAQEALSPEENGKEVEETKAKETKTKKSVPAIDYSTPRRSVAFIGSECYPFVKTGGLGDVMYALPKELVKLNCDVRVIIPRYKCIPQQYQEKMTYKGSFYMDLCSDGRQFYVGIMEYVQDGVVYDFIDNEEFFSAGNPYISLVDDIPKYCYFSKAALAALNYLDWIPDIIHCHDWQAALSPVFLRTKFQNTKLKSAQTIFTIHNLKFQGIYDIPKIRYWSGLPSYVFEMGALKQNFTDANMLKGGLTYANIITTVSNTYAYEIQTPEYGEHLDAHLRYHSGKLRGIVNGIDYDIWNTKTDERMTVHYDTSDVLEKKKLSKKKMQEELGLVVDENKFVLGLISRLTDQKGLDLVNAILPQIMDEHTQLVILGTGDGRYENAFRYYENRYKGRVCSNIMYDETRSHRIYAGADAFLVPSKFEPCGLTQLIAMHCGTIPIVRETGGLKDTVEPYNKFINSGNGFTFDRYDAGLLLDAINRAKTLYFTERNRWDEMVLRDMDKDVSWTKSAWQYKNLYLEMTR